MENLKVTVLEVQSANGCFGLRVQCVVGSVQCGVRLQYIASRGALKYL